MSDGDFPLITGPEVRAWALWAAEAMPASPDEAPLADHLIGEVSAQAERVAGRPGTASPGDANERLLEIALDLDPGFGNGALWMRVAHLYWAFCFGDRDRHWSERRLRREVVRWYFEVASPSPEPWRWQMPPSVRDWLASVGIRTRVRRQE